MARKRFSGDNHHRLPEGRVEPYRLWFEFLKLVLEDPSLNVERTFYRSWGDVAGSDFDKWWKVHWRDLFAVPAPVVLIDRQAGHGNEGGGVSVAVALGYPRKEVVAAFRRLLAKIDPTGNGKRRQMPKGRFRLSTGARLRVTALRSYLKCYELGLAGLNTPQIAKRYVSWADAWNQKVTVRKWDRPKIGIPSHLRAYVNHLEHPKNESTPSGGGYAPDNVKRMVERMVRRGRRIATNVARGDFPGRY